MLIGFVVLLQASTISVDELCCCVVDEEVECVAVSEDDDDGCECGVISDDD